MNTKKNIISVTGLVLGGLAACFSACSHDHDLGAKMPEAVVINELRTNVENVMVLAPGLEKQVTYTMTPSNVTYPVLKWRSVDETVATVSKDGLVKGLSVGTSSIIVTQEPGITELKTFTVNVKPVATAIQLQQTSLYQRTTKQMVVDITPVGGYDVFEWSSSDEGLATVDENGLVTASDTRHGNVTITARSTDGSNLKTSAVIEVKEIVPVTGIQLEGPGYDLNIGDQGSIFTTLIPADATADLLEWSTSDEKIVAVNSSGEVTGVGYGTATITAKAESGVTKTIDITVGEGTINREFSAGLGSWTLEQSGASYQLADGYGVINMQSGSKWRGDFGPSTSAGRRDIVLNVGTYRYFAVKMTRPGAYILNNNGQGTIVLDTSKGRYQQQQGNGNNRYSILGYEGNEGDCPMNQPCVVYFDLQSGFGNTPYYFPTDATETLNSATFKLLVADVPNTYEGTFNVYWAHMFKTKEEMQSFAAKH